MTNTSDTKEVQWTYDRLFAAVRAPVAKPDGIHLQVPVLQAPHEDTWICDLAHVSGAEAKELPPRTVAQDTLSCCYLNHGDVCVSLSHREPRAFMVQHVRAELLPPKGYRTFRARLRPVGAPDPRPEMLLAQARLLRPWTGSLGDIRHLMNCIHPDLPDSNAEAYVRVMELVEHMRRATRKQLELYVELQTSISARYLRTGEVSRIQL